MLFSAVLYWQKCGIKLNERNQIDGEKLGMLKLKKKKKYYQHFANINKYLDNIYNL